MILEQGRPLVQCVWCPCKKRRTETQAQGRPPPENGRWKGDCSATCTSQGKPRVAGDHPRLGENHEIDSPSGSSGGITLLTPWFQTSSLQNRERINFCYFKHLVCGGVLEHPWETETLTEKNLEYCAWKECFFNKHKIAFKLLCVKIY